MTSQPAPGSDHASPRGVARLLELQDLDLAIDRLQVRLSTLEAGYDLRLARSRQADAEARLGELRMSIEAVATEQRRLENDVDSVQRKADAERSRLYDGSVANPKELQSIQAEVRSLEGRKSRMEDTLLDIMERREELDQRLAPIEAEATAARGQVGEIEQGSAREIVEIERAFAERSAEREALVPSFDPDLLDLYQDLRRQKKGVGAARLVDGVCQGCHQMLSAVYLDRLKKSEGIRRCEYCRRILVFE